MVKKTKKCVESDTESEHSVSLEVEDDIIEEEIDDFVPPPEPEVKIPVPGITLFYGKTMSGKTNFMKVLLKKYISTFSALFIFCGTTGLSDDWNFVDKRCVYKIDKTTDEKIKTILKCAAIAKKKKQYTLIILDDCMGKDFHHNPLWDELASSSRHSNISIWLSIQHVKKISPAMRENASLAFITKLSTSNLKSLAEFSYGFKKDKDFIQYVDSNSAIGKVFWNDLKDAYATDSYGMLTVPLADEKFKIKLS